MTLTADNLSPRCRRGLVLFGVGLLLAACSYGDYEKGEGDNSLLRADFGEMYTEADNSVKTLETDDGYRITLEKPYTAQWLSKPDTLYRALLYYKLPANEAPQIVSAVQVPTVSPHPTIFFHDTIITHPVGFESAWMSRNCRYLNLGLLVKTGSLTDDRQLEKQQFSIVRDTLRLNPDSTRTLCLRLYHDQANQPEYYTQDFFLSVRTSPSQADSVSITINTYDGQVQKTLPIKVI
jgi:hypothetical protein